MNANELADELLAVVNVSSHVKMCASDMLRRQQAEIERLTTKNLEWLANWNEQQAEIEALKILVDELAGYKASYENCHRACSGYGMN